MLLEDVLLHVLTQCDSANHRYVAAPRSPDWITHALDGKPPVPCGQCHNKENPEGAGGFGTH